VTDVQYRDGAVVHEVADQPSFEPGDDVVCAVDPDFRTYCMRAHTASHVLYGAGRRLLGDLGYGGFGISDEKVRVDFTTSTDVDDDTLVELERLVNRAVWDSLAVDWETVDREMALDRDDVAFNTKTEEGSPARRYGSSLSRTGTSPPVAARTSGTPAKLVPSRSSTARTPERDSRASSSRWVPKLSSGEQPSTAAHGRPRGNWTRESTDSPRRSDDCKPSATTARRKWTR
jgi:hypothetical protein